MNNIIYGLISCLLWWVCFFTVGAVYTIIWTMIIASIYTLYLKLLDRI